jgi:cell division protein FtsB
VTDDTGEQHETSEVSDDAAIVADITIDEVVPDITIDAIDPVDLDPIEEEIAADDLDADEDDLVAVAAASTRERHPAGAAALAKRVAMDRPTRIGVASLVFVALMFMFVFPTRSYLAQQRQVRDARDSVQVLRAQNAKLAAEAQRLQTPSEIEKLARSQFNMVYEGEQAYSVVPPHGSATTTTSVP